MMQVHGGKVELQSSSCLKSLTILLLLFCSDIDECSDRVLACHGLDEICTNTEGSFRCDCAEGFIRMDSVCVKKQLPRECHLMLTMDTYKYMNRKFAQRKPNWILLFSHPSADFEEKGLFEDIQDDEVEILKQMFFGVVLCALATLASKGDLVYTSVFMGALAAMAGYWLSDRGDRLLNSFVKGH